MLKQRRNQCTRKAHTYELNWALLGPCCGALCWPHGAPQLDGALASSTHRSVCVPAEKQCVLSHKTKAIIYNGFKRSLKLI